MMRLFRLALLVTALAAPIPGHAVVVTDMLTVAGAGLVDISGLGAIAPTDPASLSFTVSFNPALGDVFDNTTDIVQTGSGLTVDGGLGFDYDSSSDMLTIGGAGLSGIGITAGTNDVLVVVDDASTTPVFDTLIYTSLSSAGIFDAAGGTVSGTVQIPEPSTLGLFAAAIALAAIRRPRPPDVEIIASVTGPYAPAISPATITRLERFPFA